jgi:hypothetical protein
MNYITQYPHCDAKVLHAPEDNCKYCNAHPDWQELRKMWGIAFTGHSNDIVRYTDWDGKEKVRTLIPCPSEWDRSVETINKWGGNVPMTPEAEKQMEEYFSNLRETLKDLELDEHGTKT